MNNQMNNFAYRYGDKSIRGRSASPGNKFESGKKPMSTMAPVIIFDKNKDLYPTLIRKKIIELAIYPKNFES